jgi:hypothetical protein
MLVGRHGGATGLSVETGAAIGLILKRGALESLESLEAIGQWEKKSPGNQTSHTRRGRMTSIVPLFLLIPHFHNVSLLCPP